MLTHKTQNLDINLNHVVIEIDRQLRVQKSFNYIKVSIYQCLAVSVSVLIWIIYPLKWFSAFVQYSSGAGFLGFFLAQTSAERKIQAIVSEQSLEHLCIIEDHLLEKREFSDVSLVLRKLSFMRDQVHSQQDYNDYLDSIKKSFSVVKTSYPEHLETFYRNIRSYNQKNIFMRIKDRYYGVQSYEIEQSFWIEILQEAFNHKMPSLIDCIYYDRYQQSTESKKEFLQLLQEKKMTGMHKSHLPDTDRKDSDLGSLKKNQFLIRCLFAFMQMGRFFGVNILLTAADIDFYITKELVISNNTMISQGFSATATFLGLTFTNAVFFTGLVSLLGLGYYLGKLLLKSLLSKAVSDLSFSEIIVCYQNSLDPRWKKLLITKIEDEIANNRWTKDIIDQVASDDQKMVFRLVLEQYYFYKRNGLSYDNSSLLKASICELKSGRNNSMSSNINQRTDINPENLKNYNKAISHKKNMENVMKIFFPINTFNSFFFSALILFAPISSLAFLSLVTVFPALAAIATGCVMLSFYAYHYVSFQKSLNKIPLGFLIEEQDDQYRAKILKARLNALSEEEYHRYKTEIVTRYGDSVDMGSQRYVNQILIFFAEREQTPMPDNRTDAKKISLHL